MGAALLLASCSGTTPSGSALPDATVGGSVAPTPTVTPGIGEVVPAPGSASSVYAPNPAAIVVAIDPGHGGCLDWGVADPWDNTEAHSEKAITLGIGLALRSLLEAQGITVVMTRTTDVALAGSDYAPQGCTGDPWRDVNQDGESGFGPGIADAVQTRDELSARIDLANLARADVTISIHINSMTQNGQIYKIAATQTYYTDALMWADASRRLAQDVQSGVVRAMASTGYARQDRGVDGTAPYLYILKPPDPTDPRFPRRGLFMPAILSEVGSISLPAEAALLLTPAGQQEEADGVLAGIATYLAARPLAVRIDAEIPGGVAGVQPDAVPGSGPPFWAPVLPAPRAGTYRLTLRLTNTGTQAWPAGSQLLAGWAPSGMPYLPGAPGDLAPLGDALPALPPGASVEVPVSLAAPQAAGRDVAWITLRTADGTLLTDVGSAPLQLATSGQ
jgi:N-acetylmuramoyl-L-alanine amidase